MSEQGRGELRNHPIWALVDQESAEKVEYEKDRRKKFMEGDENSGPVERWLRRMMAPVETDVRNFNASPITDFVVATGRMGDIVLLTRLFKNSPIEFDPDSKKK